MRSLIRGTGAADIKQRRTVLSSVAIVAILIGFFLLGAVPRPTPPSPPISASNSLGSSSFANSGQPPGAIANEVDSDEYSIRDYSEFGAQPIADLPSSDWLGLLIELVFKLGLIIGLIYVTIRLLGRYLYRDRNPVSTLKPVSHLGTLNLTPQGSVHLIEVGRKLLVVGATQTQLSLLSEITDPEEIGEVRAQCAENPPMDQFIALVNAARRRFGDHEATEGVKSSTKKD